MPEQQQGQPAGNSSSSTGSNSSAGDTEVDKAAAAANAVLVQQRSEAAALLQQARQQLQQAEVLKLPKTLLAWEDESLSAAAAADGQEPAMHLHRGLLPPHHERPERLRVIEARLRAAGLMGEWG